MTYDINTVIKEVEKASRAAMAVYPIYAAKFGCAIKHELYECVAALSERRNPKISESRAFILAKTATTKYKDRRGIERYLIDPPASAAWAIAYFIDSVENLFGRVPLGLPSMQAGRACKCAKDCKQD